MLRRRRAETVAGLLLRLEAAIGTAQSTGSRVNQINKPSSDVRYDLWRSPVGVNVAWGSRVYIRSGADKRTVIHLPKSYLHSGNGAGKLVFITRGHRAAVVTCARAALVPGPDQPAAVRPVRPSITDRRTNAQPAGHDERYRNASGAGMYFASQMFDESKQHGDLHSDGMLACHCIV
jgi:hypothetical protein